MTQEDIKDLISQLSTLMDKKKPEDVPSYNQEDSFEKEYQTWSTYRQRCWNLMESHRFSRMTSDEFNQKIKSLSFEIDLKERNSQIEFSELLYFAKSFSIQKKHWDVFFPFTGGSEEKLFLYLARSPDLPEVYYDIVKPFTNKKSVDNIHFVVADYSKNKNFMKHIYPWDDTYSDIALNESITDLMGYEGLILCMNYKKTSNPTDYYESLFKSMTDEEFPYYIDLCNTHQSIDQNTFNMMCAYLLKENQHSRFEILIKKVDKILWYKNDFLHYLLSPNEKFSKSINSVW